MINELKYKRLVNLFRKYVSIFNHEDSDYHLSDYHLSVEIIESPNFPYWVVYYELDVANKFTCSGKTFDQACDLAISFLENQIKVWESDNDNENK